MRNTVYERHNNSSIRKGIYNNRGLYLLLVPAFLYFIIFHYTPMLGAQIAFKDFLASKGIWGSPWAGLKHFRQFFSSYYFPITLRNTLLLRGYNLLAGFPLPIVLALMLHSLRGNRYRKLLQTTFYAPNFISNVIMASMVFIFLSPTSGLINILIEGLGGEAVFFMARPDIFPHILIIANLWQFTGFNAVIYLGVLTNVAPSLHESAMIDGASRFQRILHIELPTLVPTAVLLLILEFGRLMSIGFDRLYLLQTPLNLPISEVIPTYIYKVGVLGTGAMPRFAFGTAIGLFQSLVNLVLILIVNWIAGKYSEHRLF